MSRAFVKEDGPEVVSLPDLPVSPGPNWVTPEGLAALRARLAARQAELGGAPDRPERLDRLPEAAARARHPLPGGAARLGGRRGARGGPRGSGLRVRVTVGDGHRARTFRIVGEDERTPAGGLITAQSPLARALRGSGWATRRVARGHAHRDRPGVRGLN
jgi:hypothetical protein